VSQEPRVHVAPPRPEKTFGDLAAYLASDYGLTPDPWQRIVLDDWLAVQHGRWASLTCGLAVPRQNGKNAVIEVRELFGMVGRGEKILHTAHEVKTARKAFKRLQFFFGSQVGDPAAKFPELNALVREVRNVNGQEAIYLANGGSVEIVARSKNSGRGFTVDVLVMDEAQEMSEEDLEALMPTTSAAPKGDPQWIFTGTPPGPMANGEVFTRVRDEALEGGSKRLAWHEWSAPRDFDPDDREVWKLVNPATITGRLQMDVIEGERARFSDDGFARERLGVWRDDDDGPAEMVPMSEEAWAATALEVPRESLANPTFFVTISKGMLSASITAAAMYGGRPHVELADHRPGTAWLSRRIRELADRYSGAVFGAFSSGPVKSWVPTLGELGVELKMLTVPETASACAHFQKLGQSREFTHSPRDVFAESLKGARTRELDGGSWVWDWRKSSGDLAPVSGATGVLWLLESVNQHSDPGVYVF
jgi:hypothetical protein